MLHLLCLSPRPRRNVRWEGATERACTALQRFLSNQRPAQVQELVRASRVTWVPHGVCGLGVWFHERHLVEARDPRRTAMPLKRVLLSEPRLWTLLGRRKAQGSWIPRDTHLVYVSEGFSWGHTPQLTRRNGLSVLTQSLQSCLTLCNPMDCSPPGSSVCGILQARILKWVAMPSSRGSS